MIVCGQIICNCTWTGKVTCGALLLAKSDPHLTTQSVQLKWRHPHWCSHRLGPGKLCAQFSRRFHFISSPDSSCANSANRFHVYHADTCCQPCHQLTIYELRNASWSSSLSTASDKLICQADLRSVGRTTFYYYYNIII